MDITQLEIFIKGLSPEAEIKAGKQFPEVTVPPAQLYNLALNLRNHSLTQFDFLFNLTGIDMNGNPGTVYHLRSTLHGNSLVLKTFCTSRNEARLDSVSTIWKAAEYFENEVYDLLGIQFTNHPDPRRLFMEETDGYPLRKDFTDPINIVSK